MRKPLIYIADALLILVAAHCTVGALVSAFSFDVSMSGMGGLMAVFIVCSAVAAVVTIRFRVKGFLVICIPAVLLIWYNFGQLAEDFRFVAYTITSHYNEWTPIPVIFGDAANYDGTPELFFTYAGVVIICLLAAAVCLKHSALFAALVTLPPVFLTFVLVDTRPDTIYLLSLTAVYLSLVLGSAAMAYDTDAADEDLVPGFEKITDAPRENRYPQMLSRPSVRFAVSVVISVVFILFVYILTPPSQYQRARHTENIRAYINSIADRVSSIFLDIPGDVVSTVGKWFSVNADGVWMFSTNRVEIAKAGERIITDRALMEISASQAGTYYLRGFAMGDFDGRAWRRANSPLFVTDVDDLTQKIPASILSAYASIYADDPEYEGPPIPSVVGMTIRRRGDLTMVDYVPYFPGEEFVREYLDSDDDNPFLSDYSTRFFHVPGSVRGSVHAYNVPEIAPILQDDTAPLKSTPVIDPALADEARRAIEAANGTGNTRLEIDYATDVSSERVIVYRTQGARGEVIRIERGGVIFELLPDGDEDFGTESGSQSDTALDTYSTNISLLKHMYTAIDLDTAAGLRQLAAEAGIYRSAEPAEIVDAVTAYVRSAGRYTLTPPDIPDGEDFALYFLQTSQEGYCIHFATAATLMLRALDIPARFVSGYTATVPVRSEDRPVTLTDRNAHAWVEVLYDDAGWLPLEVTPSGSGSLIPPPVPHVPPPEYTSEPYAPTMTLPPSPSPDADAAQQASPGGSGFGSGAQGLLPGWLVNLIIFASAVIAIIAALGVRRHILTVSRKRQFGQDDTNAAALSMWRYILKISHAQAVPPTDIEDLALKARFSQHQLTEQERDYMLTYTKRLALEIYESKDSYARMWFKYVRGLY